jgi:hypothetical protein
VSTPLYLLYSSSVVTRAKGSCMLVMSDRNPPPGLARGRTKRGLQAKEAGDLVT